VKRARLLEPLDRKSSCRRFDELGLSGRRHDRQCRTWRGTTLYLSEAVIAAIAGMLLVRRQLTAASPLLRVDLLRIPHLHPVDLHLDRVFLCPDAGIRRAAFLSERPFWLFGGRDRTVDHALAGRDRSRGTACGAFGRALSRRPFGWHRTAAISCRNERLIFTFQRELHTRSVGRFDRLTYTSLRSADLPNRAFPTTSGPIDRL
jgi:hypothetical protein